MTITNMKLRNTIAVCLSASILSACSESDLVEIHGQELDDAIASMGEPIASQALPTDTGSSTSADIDLSQYELIFSDEFNDTTLDASKWSTALFAQDTVINDQLQFYVDEQNEDQTFSSPFSFDGEHLTITAVETPADQRAAANEQPYLSGVLTTRNKFDLTHGFIEARVDVEAGLGLWASVWMLASGSDGLRPEVYVMDHDGGRPDSVFHNYNYVDSEGNLRSPGQQEVELDGFANDFHTVGVQWTPDELLFYLDGQPSYRIIGENVPNEDMYLILNLAVGGIFTGAPDGTTPVPATYKVDYVRVYQLMDQ